MELWAPFFVKAQAPEQEFAAGAAVLRCGAVNDENAALADAGIEHDAASCLSEKEEERTVHEECVQFHALVGDVSRW